MKDSYFPFFNVTSVDISNLTIGSEIYLMFYCVTFYLNFQGFIENSSSSVDEIDKTVISPPIISGRLLNA